MSRLTLFLGPQGKDCRLEIGGEELPFDAVEILVQKDAPTSIRVTLADPQGVATMRRYTIRQESAE